MQYEHLVATSHLVFRMPVEGLVWQDPPEKNLIDRHVFAKLKLLRIPPSDLADDATFCRRVFFDLIGLPPRPDELKSFLADEPAGQAVAPDRRLAGAAGVRRLLDDEVVRPARLQPAVHG